ncbi:MAG: glycogen debranching protein GlgX [Planctomycetia bacterium]|nr:glycogen debranching protein GlgX [Planctomycetia bacterium]
MKFSRLKFNYPLSYGATICEDGVLFSIVSRTATGARLLFYDSPQDKDPIEIIEFDSNQHRWGDVWSLLVPGIKPGQLYHFQLDGPYNPDQGYRFNSQARLIDPYAKALCGDFLTSTDGIIRPPKCVVIDDNFDWSGDQHVCRNLSESIIYELHVRGFTYSKSSNVLSPGTYSGLIEKIPYLQSLGITAVELMPVHEFPQNEPDGTFSSHQNYWGYDPLAFFAPHRGYAKSPVPGAQVNEFKEMVKAFHQAGIEVILDVVFNHTNEGNEKGPTFSFKGIENRCYYMLDENGCYRNYSGCGNTVNGNHPLTRSLIFDCLRYWVCNYHIDGFRFDLASILSRDRNGNLVANPPLLETISEDPMLADTKIIAEAWDAAGAYQVGSFGSKRWAEWNGRYRDDVRRFWRGDPSTLGSLATRMAGSSDLYQANGRGPFCSINFITSHDGFTLNDLVSYNYKHNEENGEGNRDGDNNNFSCNYGVEGPTSKADIEAIRTRQIKNFLTTLFFSQGVPMIVAGDEVRRTQRGNNNAYCQNSPISWFDWTLIAKNEDILRFFRTVVEFRKKEPSLRQRTFLSGQPRFPGGLPDISWFGRQGGNVDWGNPHLNSLVCLIAAVDKTDLTDEASRFHLLLMMNSSWEPQDFYFPAICQHPAFHWRLFIDSAADSPNDIFPDFDGEKAVLEKPVPFLPLSCRVYVSKV